MYSAISSPSCAAGRYRFESVVIIGYLIVTLGASKHVHIKQLDHHSASRDLPALALSSSLNCLRALANAVLRFEKNSELTVWWLELSPSWAAIWHEQAAWLLTWSILRLALWQASWS
jgi:hypothetical protein